MAKKYSFKVYNQDLEMVQEMNDIHETELPHIKLCNVLGIKIILILLTIIMFLSSCIIIYQHKLYKNKIQELQTKIELINNE